MFRNKLRHINFGESLLPLSSASFVFSSPARTREPWSLARREQHKLRVTECRVMRRIFGPKREEVTGGRENCT